MDTLVGFYNNNREYNDSIQSIIDTYFHTILENNIIDESLYVILIKIFCKLSEPDNAYCLLFHSIKNNIKPKPRLFLPLFEYYSYTQNYDMIDTLYNYMLEVNVYPTIDIYICMLYIILNIKRNTKIVGILLQYVLTNMFYYRININAECINIIITILNTHTIQYSVCDIQELANNICGHCGNKLVRDRLTHTEIDTIKNYILKNSSTYKKSFKKLDTYLKTNKKIDIIIDGANCGFFFNCRKKKFNIHTLFKIYNSEAFKDVHVVIFLNKSRIKELPNIAFEKYNICITPKGINDDLFWLYASIYNKDTLVLTNDVLRDHINNLNNIDNNNIDTMNMNNNVLKRWSDIKKITYSFSENAYIFNFPHIYKKNIHSIFEHIHIPMPQPYNQKYICMKNTLL